MHVRVHAPARSLSSLSADGKTAARLITCVPNVLVKMRCEIVQNGPIVSVNDDWLAAKVK